MVKRKIVVSVTAVFIFFIVESAVSFGVITETHVVIRPYSRYGILSMLGNCFADLLFLFRIVISEIHGFEFTARQFLDIVRVEIFVTIVVGFNHKGVMLFTVGNGFFTFIPTHIVNLFLFIERNVFVKVVPYDSEFRP